MPAFRTPGKENKDNETMLLNPSSYIFGCSNTHQYSQFYSPWFSPQALFQLHHQVQATGVKPEYEHSE
jgi:hypothetical protein